MSQSHRSESVVRALGAAALMALANGCYAEAAAEPEYVETTTAPVDIDVAPHYEYEGRTVYYTNDHWYARDRDHWVYYRDEPPVLRRQRVRVQEAPRARDERHEERHVARPREEAPPARRVQ